MKLSFWDILASMVMLAGLALVTIFLNIFFNPYTFINPFPPPTPVNRLNVPTLTPSPRSLPELWTATPETPGVIDGNTVTPTATITGTHLVLPTGTATRTRTATPTTTKTITRTPNRTQTSVAFKTATRTKTSVPSDTTAPTTPGTPTTSSLTSDATPTFTWTASTDANGIDYYQIYWNTSSSCAGTLYTGSSSNSWTKSTITVNDTYYVCVRAFDDAGNHSGWAGPSAGFTFSDVTNPTDPGTPTTVSPATDSTPTFTWTVSTDSGSGLAGYEVYWNTINACGATTLVTTASYTPTALTTNGAYYICVRARDNVGNLSNFVGPVLFTYSGNVAPVITSNGGGATAAVSVAENTTAVTDVNATDANGGTLTYSILVGADAALFAINTSTGVLTFNPAPDFDSPTDVGGNNVYDVTVLVTDSGTLTDSQAIAVTVTDVNEAPIITSNGGGASASISVAENTTAVTTVTATDVDAGATQTYSITGGADAAKFAINPLSGDLTFSPAPNFEIPTDVGGNNIYNVTVQVSDGSLSDTQTIAVTVTNVNDLPPVITSNGGGDTASASVPENSTAVTTVIATDGDAGTTLAYTISGGADSALFTLNPTTGVLIFTSAPDFESPADADTNNIYEVTVQASDGTFTDSQDISVTVTDVNEAPVITSDGGAASASLSVAENSTGVTTVTATDVDSGATQSYSISGGADSALFSIDGSSGVLTFNSAPNFESPSDAGGNNVYNVTVQVSDSSLSDTQTIAVTVTDVNEAPTDITLSANSVAEGQASGTTVGSFTTTDPDGGSHTYSLVSSGGCPGTDNARFTISSNDLLTAEIFGSPATYAICVQTTDSGTLTFDKPFTITVP